MSKSAQIAACIAAQVALTNLRRCRRLAAALLAAGLLWLLFAPATFAATRRDNEGGPTTTCPTDSGISASLSWTGQPLIGVDVFVHAQSGTLFDHRAAGGDCRVDIYPLPSFQWQLVSKPSGSSAGLIETSTLRPRLIGDLAGDYRIRFTACPSGCTVPSVGGGTFSVAAESQELTIPIADRFAPRPRTEALVPPRPPAIPDPALDSNSCALGADKWNAAWVVVRPWTGPEDYRTLQGKVHRSKVSRKDNIFNHDSQDHNSHVEPDPAFLNLKPASQNDLEVEWERHHFPDFFWPTPGDRLTAKGFWIQDCDHGARAEIHPPVLNAAHRPRVVEIPPSFGLGSDVFVPGIVTDIWIHDKAGEVTDNCSDTGLHTEGDSGGSGVTCLPEAAGFDRNPIRQLHSFDIHLPQDPRELIEPVQGVPPVPLFIDIQKPVTSFGPDPVIVQDSQDANVLHVTINLTNHTGSSYARRIVAAWAYPSPDNGGLRRWKLRINSLDVGFDGDGRLRGDGDWWFWANTNSGGDEWTRLFGCDGCVNGHEDFGNQPFETGASSATRSLGPDHLLLPGQKIYLHTGGFEEDWFYTDATGSVTVTLDQKVRTYSTGSYCRKSGNSGCARYTLNYQVLGGDPVPAQLSPAGEALYDDYTVVLGGHENVASLPAEPLVLGLPSEIEAVPGQDVQTFDLDDFFHTQGLEDNLAEVANKEIGGVIKLLQKDDPESLARLIEQLRREAAEALATDARDEVLISLGDLRLAFGESLWQSHFGDIEGVPAP